MLQENNMATLATVLNAIQHHFTSEIILLESQEFKGSSLQDLFEVHHLPVFHLNNEYTLQFEHACPQDGKAAVNLRNLKHLPWRDSRKSAITWLKPKSLNDTKTFMNFLLR